MSIPTPLASFSLLASYYQNENETTCKKINIQNVVDPATSTTFQTTSITTHPKNSNSIVIYKSKFVSDAQRARIASEPVALLREKLATQYGITKKN